GEPAAGDGRGGDGEERAHDDADGPAARFQRHGDVAAVAVLAWPGREAGDLTVQRGAEAEIEGGGGHHHGREEADQAVRLRAKQAEIDGDDGEQHHHAEGGAGHVGEDVSRDGGDHGRLCPTTTLPSAIACVGSSTRSSVASRPAARRRSRMSRPYVRKASTWPRPRRRSPWYSGSVRWTTAPCSRRARSSVVTDSISGTVKTRAPPGRSTRCTSAKARRSSGTCSKTSVLVTRSNAASPKVRRCTSWHCTPSRNWPAATSSN